VGGGIGAVEHHSESNEAYFAHTPGLRVVACADANDAYHMIQQSIRSNDPVIFYEPKRQYWSDSTNSRMRLLGATGSAKPRPNPDNAGR
jgi:2-oxoisovalerate dehydrogenase E1 component beta subunit